MVDGYVRRGAVILTVWFAPILVAGSQRPASVVASILTTIVLGLWVFAVVDGVRWRGAGTVLMPG
jgi:hypothetical protein